MSKDECEIRALFEKLGKAHLERNADEIVDCYAPDAVIYGLAPPLREPLDRDGIATWLKTWQDPIRIDAAEHVLTVGGELAYSTALNRMRGTKVDGSKIFFISNSVFANLLYG